MAKNGKNAASAAPSNATTANEAATATGTVSIPNGQPVRPLQLRKLNPKSLAGLKRNQTLSLNEGEKRRKLGRMVGLVTGYKMIDSDYGDQQCPCFTGKIGAQAADGTRYVAPKCFLPEPAQSEILASLKEQEGNGEVMAVEFAIDLEIVESNTSSGYEYVTTSAIPDTIGDSIIEKLLSGQSVRAMLPNAAPERKALPDAA